MSGTREEFEAYVDVQRSGITNMMDIKTVREISGLGRPKIIEIMEKYDIYKRKYNENEQKV